MQCGDEDGHGRREAQRLGGALVRFEIDERPQVELLGHHGRRRPQTAQRCAAGLGQRRQHREQRGGQAAGSADDGLELGQLRLRRQAPDDQEVPHRFERPGAREVRGVVAAVVEATGLAIDVADGRVGDGDAVEAGGYVDQGAHDFMFRGARPLINIDQINVDLGLHCRGGPIRRCCGGGAPPRCPAGDAVRLRQPRAAPTTDVGRRADVPLRRRGPRHPGRTWSPGPDRTEAIDRCADRHRRLQPRRGRRPLPRAGRRRAVPPPLVRTGRRAAVDRRAAGRGRALGRSRCRRRATGPPGRRHHGP